MKENISRREFMALIAAGAGAAVMPSPGDAKEPLADPSVPKRAFGSTGVNVSKLCYGGGSFAGIDAQALLDEALKRGVDCWEAVSFAPKIYGEYFKKNPEARKKIFLTAKVYSANPAVMQEQLDKTLKDNETSIIDFLALHPVSDVKELGPDVRKWAEKVKKEGKIRFFGFCTHKNMISCLSGGADLGWIDGIQTVYNYRMQGNKRMEEALTKCREKGIGLIAVKSMALSVLPKAELQKFPLSDEKVNSLLVAHHISFEQAKMKAIWQNPHITSICSLMPTPAILQSNISVAMEEAPLAEGIKKTLKDYADATGKYFCGRCGSKCEGASEDKIPIFDLMEMLMYSRAYNGATAMIAKKWAQIPPEIRKQIPLSDYSLAEKVCPHKMPIAQLMKDAYQEFNKL